MIPLPRMGDYCDGIERINIELSTQNKLAPVRRSSPSSCRGRTALDTGDANIGRDELIGERRPGRLDTAHRRRAPPLAVAARHLDLPLAEAEPQFAEYGVVAGELSNRAASPKPSTACRTTRFAPRGRPSCAPRQDLRRPAVRAGPRPLIHREVLRGRVFVALHMHAGDGNVYTNIPVNSDNYEMLQTANRAVDRIMAWPARWTA